ncbi:MAG: glycosyltransferase family 2 protein [Planctomycetota bacterium]|nr:MAG: glycosyltransferase family 2 protein [Planctomycetota bacterium]
MKVALLIPTLNEIDGVESIMPRIKDGWVDEIVFIDGNSTDGTSEYVKKNNYVLFSENGEGLRSTMLKAVDEIESDTVITFSPDGNCIPELIPSLVAKMKEGYDMVIASRYREGAKSYDDNLVTAFGNWMFTTLVNLLYSAKYTDVMNIYRIYKKSLIKELDMDKEITYSTPERLLRTGISWEIILSIRAAKRGLKIAEIPGDEPARIGGEAKLKAFRWGAAYLFQLIREKFWWS